jgi:fatty-acyl-CoA synthase
MDIWGEFKNRFKIPRILEFFGATEGTETLASITGTVGAIGRMSTLMVNHISIHT